MIRASAVMIISTINSHRPVLRCPTLGSVLRNCCESKPTRIGVRYVEWAWLTRRIPREAVMTVIKAIVKNGKIELDAPDDWPEGTEVLIEPAPRVGSLGLRLGWL